MCERERERGRERNEPWASFSALLAKTRLDKKKIEKRWNVKRKKEPAEKKEVCPAMQYIWALKLWPKTASL